MASDRDYQNAVSARFLARYPTLCLDIHPDDEMYAFGRQHLGLVGSEAFREYLQTGRINFMMLEQVLAWAGKRWSELSAILDFASGYGRTTRFLITAVPKTNVWISDILAPAIAFQTSTLGVEGVVSQKDPDALHLPRSFDVISVISLFSHLPHKTFGAWLEKLSMSLDAGGILVLSTHGPHVYRALFGREMEKPFVFNPTSEIPSLETDSYGQTFCEDSYVNEILDRIPGVALMAYIPQGLNNHQDVYVIGRGCPIPSTPCRPRTLPTGTIEYIHSASGSVEIRGWALDTNDSGPVSAVELYLDDQYLGDADLNEMRPDLVEVFGHGPSVQGGWSFSGTFPDRLRDARWLTAWLEDRAGGVEFLLAKNEPRSTPSR